MLPLDRQNELREAFGRRHPGWLPATEQYALLVRQRLGPAGRLLDVGCGRGGLVEQLDHPHRLLAGIDPDQHSLEEHRLPTLPRVAALSSALPFVNGVFDVVTVSWVLEHLPVPAADLAQVARVLRPGGALVFITPNRRHPLIMFNRLVSRLSRLHRRLIAMLYGRADSDTFPAFYRANTPEELERLAIGAGLILSHLEVVADPSYWAVVPGLHRLIEPLDARLPGGWRLHLVGIMERPGCTSASPAVQHTI